MATLPTLVTHLPTWKPTLASQAMAAAKANDAASTSPLFSAIHAACGPNAYARKLTVINPASAM